VRSQTRGDAEVFVLLTMVASCRRECSEQCETLYPYGMPNCIPPWLTSFITPRL
jgi:hypothetical protein